MPWLDTLGLAGETAAEVAAAAGTTGALPFEAAAVGGAAVLGGAALLGYEGYHYMTRPRTPARTPARRVRRRLTYGTPARTPRRTPARSSRMMNARVGGFLGMEKKYVDGTHEFTVGRVFSTAMADPTTNSQLTGISALDSVNTENRRDGLKARITDVFIRGELRWDSIVPGTAGSTADSELPWVRLMVVQDMQTNGAQMAASDVLQSVAQNLDPLAFRNLENTTRFKVLKDVFLHPRNQPGFSSKSGKVWIPFSMSFSGLNMDVKYKDTSATISDVVDNSLHFIALKTYSDSGAADVTTAVTCRYLVRTRFLSP